MKQQVYAAAESVTERKLLKTRIEAMAGNTMRADTNKEPTRRIEMEITMAMVTESIML